MSEAEVVVVGSQFGAKKSPKKVPAIIYSSSGWHAIAHISGGPDGDRGTAIEHGYPEPWDVFPARIMKQVDYGIKNGGLNCFVIGYKNAAGEELGVVLYLYSGERMIGCYAHRLDRNNPTYKNARDDMESDRPRVPSARRNMEMGADVIVNNLHTMH